MSKKNNSKITIINLYGGPGTGKSTISSEIFSILKKEGFNTELVREFAKDVVYEENHNQLNNQFYISAIQQKRMVDVIKYYQDRNEDAIIVTDSPIIMGIFYNSNDKNKYLNKCIIQEFKKPNGYEVANINIFLNRVEEYNPYGRTHSEEEAKKLDKKILKKLKKIDPNLLYVDVTKDTAKFIFQLLKLNDFFNEEKKNDLEDNEYKEDTKDYVFNLKKNDIFYYKDTDEYYQFKYCDGAYGKFIKSNDVNNFLDPQYINDQKNILFIYCGTTLKELGFKKITSTIKGL
jgi:hypothetical protein